MKRVVKSIAKRPITATIAVILLLGAAGLIYVTREKRPTYQVARAERGNVVQEVSVTGKTKSAQTIELAFEKTGKVIRILVAVGDKVERDQSLVELDRGELAAQLLEAQARVEAERARLAELTRGTREEDLEIKRAELEKAEQDLSNEYDDIPDLLTDAYTKSDDAVRTKTAGIFIGSKNTAYKLNFSSCNTEADLAATTLKLTSEFELERWQKELSPITLLSPRSDLENALKNAKIHIAIFKNFLEKTNEALTDGCTINNSSLDTARTNVGTARTNVVTAIGNINNQEQDIATQKLTALKIKNELNLKLAGTLPEQITAQRAVLRQAEASAQLIQTQIGKATLRAPIAGVITKEDVELGKIVSPNSPVVSMISEEALEIETFVPVVDIAKIKIGDKAKVTVDAYGSDAVFEATVVSIDPAETIIEGVATYKTVLHFSEKDDRIKPGFTANIDILTATRENVIAVPQRAVTSKNGGKFVRILVGGEVREIKVETGLRGSDGGMEITKGLTGGEDVITFIKE